MAVMKMLSDVSGTACMFDPGQGANTAASVSIGPRTRARRRAGILRRGRDRLRSFLQFATIAGVGIAAALAAAGVVAQPYPSKPIRMIVPFAAGGTTDVVGRAIGQKLGENLGQQIVIENRPGANGNIGAEIVAKAAADGYTLLMSLDSTLVINPYVYGKVPFDPVKDFAPISKVSDLPLILVTHPSFPATSARELIAYAKQNPGLNYASSGHASTPHLVMLIFERVTGTRFTHVAYKGGGAAIVDLLAGQVPMQFAGIPPVLAHLNAGKLKAVALTSRHASLPTVESFAEAGVPGLDISGWIGLLAPARTPRPIIARLHNEIVRILATPEVRARFLTNLGSNIVGNTPEQFAEDIAADGARWAQIIKDTGIKVE